MYSFFVRKHKGKDYCSLGICSILSETTKLLSIVGESFSTPTSSVWELRLLYILTITEFGIVNKFLPF